MRYWVRVRLPEDMEGGKQALESAVRAVGRGLTWPEGTEVWGQYRNEQFVGFVEVKTRVIGDLDP